MTPLPVLRWLTRPIAEMEAIGRTRRARARRAARPGPRGHGGPVGGRGGVRRAARWRRSEPGPRRRASGTLARGDRRRAFAPARPPVLGRIHDGRFLLDLRGIFADADLLVDLRSHRLAMALIIGTAGHIDHGKTCARPGAHRPGHRPAEGREGARHLDRSRLRLARRSPRGQRAGIVDVPGPRALHPQHAGGRPRHRPGAVHRRRRRRRDAADRGAPRHPAPARRPARHLRHHQDRPRRRRAGRSGAGGDRDPGARYDARRRSGRRRVDRRRERVWTRCGPRSPPSSRARRRAPRTAGSACPSTAPSSCAATASSSPARRWRATVAEGDAVRVLPRGRARAYAGSRSTAQPSTRAGRGQRVAINLAASSCGDVARGDVVCDPRLARATTRFDARVEVRPAARRAGEPRPRPCPHRDCRGARDGRAPRRQRRSCRRAAGLGAARAARAGAGAARRPLRAARRDGALDARRRRGRAPVRASATGVPMRRRCAADARTPEAPGPMLRRPHAPRR